METTRSTITTSQVYSLEWSHNCHWLSTESIGQNLCKAQPLRSQKRCNSKSKITTNKKNQKSHNHRSPIEQIEDGRDTDPNLSYHPVTVTEATVAGKIEIMLAKHHPHRDQWNSQWWSRPKVRWQQLEREIFSGGIAFCRKKTDSD